MKIKLIVALSFLIFSFYFAPDVAAAPAYGTMLPNEGEFFLGYESYNLLDRDLEANHGSVRSNQHFILITYGFRDWFSIDLKGGVGNIKQHPENATEIDYLSSFAGGYGFRIKLVDENEADFSAVFGLQHISVHPHGTRVNAIKHQAILDDWQASLLFSKKVGKIVPYLGPKISRVDYIHWEADERKRRTSDLTEGIGIIAGVDLPFLFDSWLNFEGHFIDEKAVSTAIIHKF